MAMELREHCMQMMPPGQCVRILTLLRCLYLFLLKRQQLKLIVLRCVRLATIKITWINQSLAKIIYKEVERERVDEEEKGMILPELYSSSYIYIYIYIHNSWRPDHSSIGRQSPTHPSFSQNIHSLRIYDAF